MMTKIKMTLKKIAHIQNCPSKKVEHIHDVPSSLRVCNGPERLVAAVGQLNSVNLLLPSNLEAQKMLTLISRTSHTGFLIRFNGFFYDPGIVLF